MRCVPRLPLSKAGAKGGRKDRTLVEMHVPEAGKTSTPFKPGLKQSCSRGAFDAFQ